VLVMGGELLTLWVIADFWIELNETFFGVASARATHTTVEDLSPNFKGLRFLAQSLKRCDGRGQR
jgi:hypothetical protein